MNDLILTLLKTAHESAEFRIEARKFQYLTQAKYDDINKLKILCSEYGNFSGKGFGHLTWERFTLNINGIKYIKDLLNTQLLSCISLIPQIQIKIANNKWNNNKWGYFEIQKWETTPNINLYFHEFEPYIKDDGKEGIVDTYPTIQHWEQNRHNHIIAKGFVAFYLYWIQSEYKNRSVTDLFDTYFVNLRKIYITEKKTHLEYIKTTDDEFDNMFYTQHIDEEKQRIEDSQGLFEYLTPQDKATIQSYINVYSEHITKYNQIQQPAGTEKPKSFTDYLHHENKSALILKLHELLDKIDSGRTVARVLLALEKKNYLIGKSYKVKDVITEFYLKCSRQSITAFTSGNAVKPIPDAEIQQVIGILP